MWLMFMLGFMCGGSAMFLLLVVRVVAAEVKKNANREGQ